MDKPTFQLLNEAIMEAVPTDLTSELYWQWINNPALLSMALRKALEKLPTNTMSEPSSTGFEHLANVIMAEPTNLSEYEVSVLANLIRFKQDSRPALPRYLVDIDYEKSVEDLYAEGKYATAYEIINTQNFPSLEKGKIQQIIYLMDIGREVHSEEAKKELEKQGFRPVTIRELLALGAQYPELQKDKRIVGLGSEHYFCMLGTGVPVLVFNPKTLERFVTFEPLDGETPWMPFWSFAVVRK